VFGLRPLETSTRRAGIQGSAGADDLVSHGVPLLYKRCIKKSSLLLRARGESPRRHPIEPSQILAKDRNKTNASTSQQGNVMQAVEIRTTHALKLYGTFQTKDDA
jgi:hypothetical protein